MDWSTGTPFKICLRNPSPYQKSWKISFATCGLRSLSQIEEGVWLAFTWWSGLRYSIFQLSIHFETLDMTGTALYLPKPPIRRNDIETCVDRMTSQLRGYCKGLLEVLVLTPDMCSWNIKQIFPSGQSVSLLNTASSATAQHLGMLTFNCLHSVDHDDRQRGRV